MKRNSLLVGLFLVCSLAVSVPSALAQATVWSVSSNTNQVRSEGTAEAVGQIVLTSSSIGTIKATSVLKITFGAAIANSVSSSANLTCSFTCTSDTTPITTTASGSVLSMSFTTDQAIVVGDTITVKGIRINANAFGVGNLNGAASATVPAAFQGTNPITFSGAVAVPVATVNKVATTLSFAVLDTITGLPGVEGAIITCVTTETDFDINVAENWNDALTSESDEVGLAPTGVTNGSNILITVTGIPIGVTIAPSAPVPCQSFPSTQSNYCKGGLLAIDAATPATYTGKVANDTASFFYKVTATNSILTENADFPFRVTSTGPIAPAEVPPTITATVSLVDASPTVSTDIPNFVGSEGSLAAVSIADCVTDLLLPYVSNFNGAGTAADSHYNTGITISNTTLDPFGVKTGGAVPQAGACTLWLFKYDGSAGIPWQSASVPPGGQLRLQVGDIPAWKGALSGYIIATCQFQNAHGFVSVYDNAGLGSPTFQQGYVALIIPNPSLVPRSPAGRGPTGSGEALGQ